MAAVTPPLFQNVDNVYGGDELGLPYRDLVGEGVVGADDLKVSQRAAGANMSVDVAQGVCWVKGDDNAWRQPTYRCYNDGVVNLAIAAADATNPRIDRIIAEVLDADFAGVSRTWRLRVVQGTPTAGANQSNLSGAAALPPSAHQLATVLVGAGATSIADASITDRRHAATLAGVMRVPRSRAKRTTQLSLPNSAWTTVSFPTEDYDTDAMHPRGADDTQFVINTPGVYRVTFSGVVAINGGSFVGSRIKKTTVAGASWSIADQAVDCGTATFDAISDVRVNVSAEIEMARGDYFTIEIFHDKGSAATLYEDQGASGTYACSVAIARVA